MVACDVVGYVGCLDRKESVWEGEMSLDWSTGKVRGEGEEEISPHHTARAALLMGIEEIQEIDVSSFASFVAFAVRDRDVLTRTYGVRSKPGQRNLHSSEPNT
jgi:hypothetical protein